MIKTAALLALIALFPATSLSAQDASETPRWSLAIHGGAGTLLRENMSAAQEVEYRAAMQAALDAGAKVLADGGTAMDAVEAAIVLLEDDPKFNAGRGAVFTWDGTNEMDASVMDGSNRAAGAVAGVGTVRHPIRLARAVMDDGRHVFLSGDGAEQFAGEKGLEIVSPEWFATEHRRRQLEEMKSKNLAALHIEFKFGTVGAGTYADDRSCAVSATGSGEYFIRANVAHSICDRMLLAGEGVQQAADTVMADVAELGGDGGVIVVSKDGEAVFSFNTPGMYRGRVDSAGTNEVAIFAED